MSMRWLSAFWATTIEHTNFTKEHKRLDEPGRSKVNHDPVCYEQQWIFKENGVRYRVHRKVFPHDVFLTDGPWWYKKTLRQILHLIVVFNATNNVIFWKFNTFLNLSIDFSSQDRGQSKTYVEPLAVFSEAVFPRPCLCLPRLRFLCCLLPQSLIIA